MVAEDAARDSATAFTRFGLGARPTERRAILGDPRGFVLAQIAGGQPAGLADALPSSPAIFVEVNRYLAATRAARKAVATAGKVAAAAATDVTGDNPAPQLYRDEFTARAMHAIATNAALAERLVMFWSNFFAVSADRSAIVSATAGAFEREAIRPHVFGRFADMLIAATRHPAMLAYLDNDQSIGPHSPAARPHRRGLNENLARETLELHSVGVTGGYTQADVTALAKVITGWRIGRDGDPVAPGGFFFDARSHEPGPFTVMGRRYRERGVEQGLAVLADLAARPATAVHVATRLARHFVADAPPPALVNGIAAAFRASGGDLAEVTRALVTADSAWQAIPAKFLPPYDFVIAAERLTGGEPQTPLLFAALHALGQRPWTPSSPAGWPDGDDAWTAPDALLARVDWSLRFAAAAAGSTDIASLAEGALGPRLGPSTREAIARAASRAQALALLLSSNEFQTR